MRRLALNNGNRKLILDKRKPPLDNGKPTLVNENPTLVNGKPTLNNGDKKNWKTEIVLSRTDTYINIDIHIWAKFSFNIFR